MGLQPSSCVPSSRIPPDCLLVSIGMMSTIWDTALSKLKWCWWVAFSVVAISFKTARFWSGVVEFDDANLCKSGCSVGRHGR